MNNKRWKNYSLWIAIFAFVPILSESMGMTAWIPDNYEMLVMSFLSILVLAGIINDPNTNSKWLKDDEDKR